MHNLELAAKEKVHEFNRALNEGQEAMGEMVVDLQHSLDEMRRERDEARGRAMTLSVDKESLLLDQREEWMARLKDEEELAELTEAVAALSKKSEDYWDE